jgi:antibiotic biosynthesis monooxygenase (ABM) superfamily enzyme
MSDDAYDFNTGRGLASGGGTPDWNNQSQVDGWNAQRNYEAMQSSMNPPASSTSFNSSPTWNSSSNSYDSYASSYRGGSYSGGSYSIRWKGFTITILAIAGLVGAVMGYNAVPRHASTEQVWLTIGGGVLKAVVIVGAALGAIAGILKAIAYLLTGIASLFRWLIGKVPHRFRAAVIILIVAAVVGGYAGYTMRGTYYGAKVETWLTVAAGALTAVLIVGAALAVIVGIFKIIKHLINGIASVIRWSVGKVPKPFRSVVVILWIAGLVGGLVGYNAVPRHASTLEVWLTTGGGALGSVLIVGAVIAVIVGTVATIR